MKLKLNPTKEQKVKLAGCVRFLYNKTIALKLNKKNKTLHNEFRIRDRFVTYKKGKTKKINSFYFNKPWLKECPKAIKQGAIADALSNLNSCFTNLKNKNIKKFTAPFRTKKSELLKGWCFSLEKGNVKRYKDSLSIYPSKKGLGIIKYHSKKQLHKLIPGLNPEMDCKIQKSMFGEYFLIITFKCKPKEIKKEVKNPVAIDPGVRKYITTYAPNNKESYILGNRWTSNIMQKCILLDKIFSIKKKDYVEKLKNLKLTKNLSKKRIDQIMKHKILKLRKKIHNLKEELKYKIANFITKEYDLIMMPKLKIDCSKKTDRRLKTKTVRELTNAGHCRFFNILEDKCWEHGKHFLQVREEYTSKTCPCCGHLNTCNEIYKCKNCEYKQDRDITGAFNILLKAVR
jgi:putative transposase